MSYTAQELVDAMTAVIAAIDSDILQKEDYITAIDSEISILQSEVASFTTEKTTQEGLITDLEDQRAKCVAIKTYYESQL